MLTANREDEELRQRHAAFYVRLAKEADQGRLTDQRSRWIDELETELANLRTALVWLASCDPDQALHFAAALSWFWLSRGHLSEGRNWLEQLLASPATNIGRERATIAKAVLGLAVLVAAQDEYESSERRFREALELFLDIGDSSGVARARLGLSDAYFVRGDVAGAHRAS